MIIAYWGICYPSVLIPFIVCTLCCSCLLLLFQHSHTSEDQITCYLINSDGYFRLQIHWVRCFDVHTVVLWVVEKNMQITEWIHLRLTEMTTNFSVQYGLCASFGSTLVIPTSSNNSSHSRHNAIVFELFLFLSIRRLKWSALTVSLCHSFGVDSQSSSAYKSGQFLNNRKLSVVRLIHTCTKWYVNCWMLANVRCSQCNF